MRRPDRPNRSRRSSISRPTAMNLIPAGQGNAVHGERELHHQREPEHRHRLPEERERRDEVIPGRIRAHRCEEFRPIRRWKRQDERVEHQLQRGGEAFDDGIEYRLGVARGIAEVAGDNVPEPADVLLVNRTMVIPKLCLRRAMSACVMCGILKIWTAVRRPERYGGSRTGSARSGSAAELPEASAAQRS